MMELFCKVFKNDILRNKIFQYVKEINLKLFYKGFGYYNFPLLLIIKTKNQSMLKDRMMLQDQNIGCNEFNKECLEYLINWKQLDLFKMVEKRFEKEILKYMNEINYFLKSNLHGLPLEMLQYLIERYEKQIDIINIIKDENKLLIIPTFNSDGSTIKLIEYLINNFQINLSISIIIKMIYNISVIQNQSKLFSKSLLDLVLENYNFQDRLEILLSSLNSSIETNDYYLFNLLILKIKELNQVIEPQHLNNDNSDDDADENSINLYDVLISKEFFQKIPITRNSLFKSKNLKLFKIIIKNKPELIKEVDKEFIQYDIIDPDIAILLLSTYDRNVIVSPRYRFNYCSIKIINGNISEVIPFMRKRVLIGGNKTVSDLTMKKLNLFEQARLNISNIINENTDGFGGDIELFKKFLSINRGLNLNLLQTLKSAILLGYKELVEIILSKDDSNKIYIITFNYNYYQLKQIFNIHGNDIMPFENGFTKIENGKLYYSFNLIQKYDYLNLLSSNEIDNENKYLNINNTIKHYLNENIIHLPYNQIDRENYLIKIYKNEDDIKNYQFKLNLIKNLNGNYNNQDNFIPFFLKKK
ncbi:hypothetical protein ACTFIY_003455 [Dictyostelium cf. discoideum]